MPRKPAPKAVADPRDTFKALRDRWHGRAVAYSLRPMTAALCYDSVIAPHSVLNPRDTWDAWHKHFEYGMWLEPKGATHDDFERKVMLSGWRLGKTADHLLELATIVDSKMSSKEQALELERLTGAVVIPVFDARADYDQTFKKGSRELLVASLVGLDVVDEDKLSLDQVLEFRRDREATTKYRRLMWWLDRQVAGMTEPEVIETLHQKLDDYTWALKKHAIKTTLGIVSETLDGKYLLGVSAVAGTAAAAGFPVLGILAGAGVAIGKIVVRVATDWLDLKDRERGEHSEVAWLYEVRKRLHV
jgi:hypothetical protein